MRRIGASSAYDVPVSYPDEEGEGATGERSQQHSCGSFPGARGGKSTNKVEAIVT
jgi:hypothetical protein